MGIFEESAGDDATDAELILAVRNNDRDAYGVLFERHRDSATRLARQLTEVSRADDLVSEAFTRVYTQLIEGRGPTEAFRAYLLTTIRRLHVDQIRRTQRESPAADERLDRPSPFVDTAELGFERTATALAFESLPERWQAVLWHLEVEGEKPADIAPLLGLSANSVSALAYRAREGLREAYLQQHINAETASACADTTSKLAAFVRGSLSSRQAAAVQRHLDECRSCMGLRVELGEFNANLGAMLAPAVLGAAALGYASMGSLASLSAVGGAGGSLGATTTGAATGAANIVAVSVTAGVVSVAAAGAITAGTLVAHTWDNTRMAAVSIPQQTQAPAKRLPASEAPTTEAPTTEAPTTEAPTTPAPSKSALPSPTPKPSKVPPTKASPVVTAPAPLPVSPTPPPVYSARMTATSITNLTTALGRRITFSMAQTGTAGASKTGTVSMTFVRPITLNGSGGNWTCSAASDYVVNCAVNMTGDGPATGWITLVGVYPAATATLTMPGDTTPNDNQQSFTAPAWVYPT